MGTPPFSEARLGSPPSDVDIREVVAPGLKDELAQFSSYVELDRVHVVMLAETGILDRQEAARVLVALATLADDGVAEFPVDPRFGSFLLQVERYMAAKVGDELAGRVHTGRSRNDLSAAASRLEVRNGLLDGLARLAGLQRVLIGLAERHVDSIMPGYTHLQRAQPITLGHYFLRHLFVLERDQQRLEGAFDRTNLSSLGGAAMAGTSWPLDRHRVAALLGHEGLVEHSTDAGVFQQDYALEALAVLGILMTNIGQVSADIYLWCTTEFGFAEAAGELSGTSSIMPQKKNPHVFEKVRGLTGRAIGWVPSGLGMARSSSSSDLDFYWGGNLTQGAIDDTRSCLNLMISGLESTKFNTDAMSSTAADGWATATGLADELVRKAGLPFRAAHRVVGRLVRDGIEQSFNPSEVTVHMLDAAAFASIGEAVSLTQEEITHALDPRACLEGLITIGSAGPASTGNMLGLARELLVVHEMWLERKQTLLSTARQRQDAAIAAIVEGA